MTVRAIIPCCGKGTRMGMQPGEAKELLWVVGEGQRVIDYWLHNLKLASIEPLVLVNDEKQDLIRYLGDKGVAFVVQEAGKEWADTVAKSRHHWAEDNVLVLPDTRTRAPVETLEEIKEQMELGKYEVLALHEVSDSSKWCIYKNDALIEKPTYKEKAWAFGLIGFKKHTAIFDRLSAYGNATVVNPGVTQLYYFEDITRKVTPDVRREPL